MAAAMAAETTSAASAASTPVLLHDDYRIALYYRYVTIPDVEKYIKWHTALCKELDLGGRVRVSAEGLNSVLSGTYENLLQYEQSLSEELSIDFQGQPDSKNSPRKPLDLDIKYCALRQDLSVEAQLFDSLSVKATPEVISLFNPNDNESIEKKKSSSRRRKGGRVHSMDQNNHSSSKSTQQDLELYPAAPHLSPQEWQERLLSSASDVILIDARNVYESNVGRFEVRGAKTLLTNTRKYASLPDVLRHYKEQLTGKNVMMYCTGGVRCERASSFLQQMVNNDWDSTLEPPRGIYQLRGGIQRYLEQYGTPDDDSSCLFKGKNFVFDPRRTDPISSREIAGHCLMCQVLHDDYDNGHAPSENKEARCCRCRVLVLVCNDCRSKVRAWGEDDKDETLPWLYCGGTECVDQGNSAEQAVLLET